MDITLSLKREIGVLFGPSGAGKSLSLRIIAGLVKPDSGTISLSGRILLNTETRVYKKPSERNIGLVFQDLALFPHLNVLENIGYGMPKGRKKEAATWLEKMHLGGLEERYPSQLSGGQKQRTALARALAPHPDLLLLDEPFSALDAPLRRNMRRELKKLHRETGIPMLYVTHYMEDVSAMGNTVFFMKEGKLTGKTPVEHLWKGAYASDSWHAIGWGTIIEGKIVQKKGGIRLSWKEGYLSLESSALHSGEAVVFIPPSNLKLLYEEIPLDSELALNVFEGTIIEAITLGHHTSLYIEAAGRQWHLEFTSESYHDMDVAEGSRVRFAVRPQDISIIKQA